MFVGAVTGINHAALQVFGQKQRRAWRGVADDHDIHPHRFDILGGVDERLALAQAGAAGTEIDRVGAKALGRQPKARSRSRGRLKEEVRDHLALEGGQLSAPPLTDLHEAFGGIEDRLDLRSAQAFEIQQMAACPAGDFCFLNGQF